MIAQDGELALTDFGLAAVPVRGVALTQAGAVMHAAYMSPEQVSGEPDAVGPSSGTHSLAVILYELLMAGPPKGRSLRFCRKSNPKSRRTLQCFGPTLI